MAINQAELDRHQELAAFLRSRRARLLPEQVGLPGGTRRRIPGLRRGEVALLAGVSPEWYTWLEQARDINVSAQVVQRLAKVLQLDANERAHLFMLALRQLPPVDTFSPPTISPALQQFLNQLGTTPASVFDARMNIVAWNDAARVIFGGYGTPLEQERNSLRRLFMSPPQHRDEEWEDFARTYVAQLRAEYGRFIHDPWWTEQIAELSRISPEFRELWARHDVIKLPEGQKTFQHPLVGEMTFDYVIFETAYASDLRIMVYTPRGNSGTAGKVERLLALEAESTVLSPSA